MPTVQRIFNLPITTFNGEVILGPQDISGFEKVYYSFQLTANAGGWTDPTVQVTLDPQHLDGTGWISDGASTYSGGTFSHGGGLPGIAIGYDKDRNISQVRLVVTSNKQVTLGGTFTVDITT